MIATDCALLGSRSYSVAVGRDAAGSSLGAGTRGCRTRCAPMKRPIRAHPVRVGAFQGRTRPNGLGVLCSRSPCAQARLRATVVFLFTSRPFPRSLRARTHTQSRTMSAITCGTGKLRNLHRLSRPRVMVYWPPAAGAVTALTELRPCRVRLLLLCEWRRPCHLQWRPSVNQRGGSSGHRATE